MPGNLSNLGDRISHTPSCLHQGAVLTKPFMGSPELIHKFQNGRKVNLGRFRLRAL